MCAPNSNAWLQRTPDWCTDNKLRPTRLNTAYPDHAAPGAEGAHHSSTRQAKCFSLSLPSYAEAGKCLHSPRLDS